MIYKIYKLLRIKQWLKNLLIFIPLLIEADQINYEVLVSSFYIFFLFSFVTSFIYVVNDWFDREEDSNHPEKKNRPFASKELNGKHAIFSLFLLALLSVPGLFILGNIFLNSLIALYFLQSILYTLYLKNFSLLEIFIVASGYVYRILIGASIISSFPSTWMIFTIGSASLLIVIVKRKIDITKKPFSELRSSFKNYSNEFLSTSIGILSATTITSYVLFTFSNYAILKFNSELLPFSSIFVFFGVLRYVQLSFKTNVSSDPINLLLKDKQLFITVFLWMVFIFSINFFK